jgi:DNA-binding transcriptional LysR family regulator
VITAATQSNEPIEFAADAARTKGRIVLVGVIGLNLPRPPFFAKELEVTPLARDRIVLIAAADHPLARRKRVSPSDLAGQNLIGFEGGSAIRRLIDEALRNAAIDVNVVMEVRSIAAILRLVDSTASLAFVSDMSAADRPVIDVRGLRIERELGLVTRRGRAVSRAARAFADELRRSAMPSSKRA